MFATGGALGVAKLIPWPFLRQVQCILSAIIGAGPAFDQPAFLERASEYCHQTRTGMDAESRRQLLLTEPPGCTQHAQDPGVRRGEMEEGDSLAESDSRMCAYLGQQEGQGGFCLLHNISLHL